MKIKVESDVFDISNRVKEIDDGYFVLYVTDKCNFELHNYYQYDTYCLTIPFESLHKGVIDLINMSNVANIDNIIEEIDKNNAEVDDRNKNSKRDVSDYMLREIFNFCNNSSKEYSNKSFTTIWR